MEISEFERLTSLEEKMKTAFNKIDNIENDRLFYRSIDKNISVIITEQKYMNAKIDALSNKVETIDSRPKNIWYDLVDRAVGGIVTGIVAFFLVSFIK